MSDEEDSANNKPGKPQVQKDRECPFCHLQFTASSLGRHLDLFIRPNNPKPSDGVHNVTEIQEIRNKITRRQPKKSSLGNYQPKSGQNGDSSNLSIPTSLSHVQSPYTPQSAPTYPVADPRRQRPPWQNLDWTQHGVMKNLTTPLPPMSDGPRPSNSTRTMPIAQPSQRLGAKRRRLSDTDNEHHLLAKRMAMDELFSHLEELQFSPQRRPELSSLSNWPLEFNPFNENFPNLVAKLSDQALPVCMLNNPMPAMGAPVQAFDALLPGQADYDSILQTLRNDYYTFTMRFVPRDDPASEKSLPDNLIRRSQLNRDVDAPISQEFFDKVQEHLAYVFDDWKRLDTVAKQAEWNKAVSKTCAEKHLTNRTLQEKLAKTETELANYQAKYKLLNDITLLGAIQRSTVRFLDQKFNMSEDEIYWNEKIRKWTGILNQNEERGLGSQFNDLFGHREPTDGPTATDGLQATGLPMLGDGYVRPGDMPEVRIAGQRYGGNAPGGLQ